MPLLLSQVYSQMLATDVKLALADLYGDEHEVVLVHSAGNADQRVEALALFEIDRTPHVAHLTSLYVPPRPAVGSLSGFAESIAVLRGPDGCPWDREQTPQSLRAGLLEEVAEALDALDRDDNDALADELGDVLLHIVMQAQMAAEAGYFTLTDVIAGIDAKIKRRHPHVWGDTAVGTSGEVEDNWAAIKALEKGRNQSPTILENIPLALPALARSQKIQSRVRKVGFDWPDISGVWEKLHEEVTELVSAETPEHRREELGDLLFVIVNLAKWLDIDAEVALREANAKFERRFRAVEQLVAERGLSMESLDLPMLETLWTQIKANER
jgi:tetrapyrrole methylase family protein/MazG family protein